MEIGDIVFFHHHHTKCGRPGCRASGIVKGAVVKVRGAHQLDLDVDSHLHQMVPKGATEGCWWALDQETALTAEVEAQPERMLVPRQPPPAPPAPPTWPTTVALALGGVALGVEIIHLLWGP